MELIDIVNKLTGKIEPVGESNTDEERFKNLENMIELMKQLHTQIDDIAYYNKDKQEYSMKKAGNAANDYLDYLGIKE